MTYNSRPSYDYEPTAEEIEAIASATPEQIAEAVTECLTDRNFWIGLLEAFIEGLQQGATSY